MGRTLLVVALIAAVGVASAINVKTWNRRALVQADADADAGFTLDAESGVTYRVSAGPVACNGAGICIDVDNFSCSGATVHGKCAGDASVICCMGKAIEKAAPAPVPAPVPTAPPLASHDVGFLARVTPQGLATINGLINSVLKKLASKPIPFPGAIHCPLLYLAVCTDYSFALCVQISTWCYRLTRFSVRLRSTQKIWLYQAYRSDL